MSDETLRPILIDGNYDISAVEQTPYSPPVSDRDLSNLLTDSGIT